MGGFDYVEERTLDGSIVNTYYQNGGYVRSSIDSSVAELTHVLSQTQQQLMMEIGRRTALEARVNELEELVKQIAKVELGLDRA